MKTTLWFALVLGALSASAEVFFGKSGLSVTIKCGINTFHTKLGWRHENAQIIETFVKNLFPFKGESPIFKRVRLIGTDLLIKDVKQEDAGTFTCEADGKPRQHTLIVASVLVSPSKVELGSEATLQCQVSGLPPQGTVQWIRPDGSPVPESQTHTLKSVAHSDGGIWKCKVSYSGEEFNYDLKLQILEPTRPTTSAPSPPKNSADINKSSCTTCVSHIPPDDDQLLLRLSWWMWVVIGVGCLIVVLLMVLVICLCKKIKRKKRKLRMQKIQNGRQPRQYCQCDRPTAAAKPQQGRRREKPSALPLYPPLLE